MMYLSPGALNAAQAETYYAEKYSHDDYYSENQTTTGQWIGKGAADLGLAGDVSRDDFSALLQGLNPHNGEVLVPHASHNDKRDAGWDAVFSAPKSISIQALVDGDPRLIAAHNRAVDLALQEVEAFALAHQKGGSELVISGNIVGAAFTHLAARPTPEQGPDPQLHTHVVLLNVTHRPDGEWRSLRPIEIYRSQIYGSAVYRAELAREVEALGYRINVTEGNGAWELAGYSREQIVEFSQRSQQISKDMAAAGLTGPQSAQIIGLQNRMAKADSDLDALKADWRARAAEYGIDTRQMRRDAWQRGPLLHDSNGFAAREAVSFGVSHTTEREAVIDRRALEAAALQHGMGRTDLDGVRTQMAREQSAHRLVPAGATDWRHPKGSFTTDAMLAIERENLEMVREGVGQATAIGDSSDVRAWGTAKGLFADQLNAAEHALTSDNWVTAIEGLAGTTKTTTVGAIREFAEREGYAVRGFGMTSGSVKALGDAGVEARTIASLIANGPPTPKSNELWFVDESSLLDTRQAHAVFTAANSYMVNRIVFVGDQKQHFAINAGNPIRQLLADSMSVAELTTIRRQRDPDLKRAVELAAQGDTKQALEALDKRGRIAEISEPGKRYERIAADYLQAHEAGQRTLVVSPANVERQALNEKIRNTLIDHGHISESGKAHTILVQRDLTDAQKKHANNYQQGDVLMFRRGAKSLGIKKGEYVRIEGIDSKAGGLNVTTAAGRHTIHPEQWKSFEAYRPEERELAAGDRVQFRAVQRALKAANGQFADIVAINDRQAVLRFDDGREVKAGLANLRHIDHGYASTSHSAQGATVDRVIVNVDSMRSAQLVNQRQLYVSISRARWDAKVYTDDRKAMGLAVARKQEKSIAIDAVRELREQEIKQSRQPTMRMSF
jgi:conjugative relaxase-like TrwC/TraI family protein